MYVGWQLLFVFITWFSVFQCFFPWPQLNGLILGINLIVLTVIVHLPFPVSSVMGSDFCNWIDISGTLYISGETDDVQMKCGTTLVFSNYKVLNYKFPNDILPKN
jgi:hypothetical protein